MDDSELLSTTDEFKILAERAIQRAREFGREYRMLPNGVLVERRLVHRDPSEDWYPTERLDVPVTPLS